MTVLINGYVDFSPEDAQAALVEATQLMADTRDQKGCRAYVWSHDPATPGRVYVYENWDSVEDLAAHLAGPYYANMLAAMGKYGVHDVEVSKFKVALEEPVYDPEGKPRADFFTE